MLEAWRLDYNTVRPHSGLGNLAPKDYANLSASGMQRAGALELPGDSAPRPVAPPSLNSSNAERILLSIG